MSLVLVRLNVLGYAGRNSREKLKYSIEFESLVVIIMIQKSFREIKSLRKEVKKERSHETASKSASGRKTLIEIEGITGELRADTIMKEHGEHKILKENVHHRKLNKDNGNGI